MFVRGRRGCAGRHGKQWRGREEFHDCDGMRSRKSLGSTLEAVLAGASRSLLQDGEGVSLSAGRMRWPDLWGGDIRLGARASAGQGESEGRRRALSPRRVRQARRRPVRGWTEPAFGWQIWAKIGAPVLPGATDDRRERLFAPVEVCHAGSAGRVDDERKTGSETRFAVGDAAYRSGAGTPAGRIAAIVRARAAGF